MGKFQFASIVKCTPHLIRKKLLRINHLMAFSRQTTDAKLTVENQMWRDFWPTLYTVAVNFFVLFRGLSWWVFSRLPLPPPAPNRTITLPWFTGWSELMSTMRCWSAETTGYTTTTATRWGGEGAETFGPPSIHNLSNFYGRFFANLTLFLPCGTLSTPLTPIPGPAATPRCIRGTIQ